MKIFKNSNNIDAVFWNDVEQYHKENPNKKKVFVWHGDSMVMWTFNAVPENEKIAPTMRFGSFLGNGNFVFYDNNRTSHYVFKYSKNWKIWREMNDYLKEHENEYA